MDELIIFWGELASDYIEEYDRYQDMERNTNSNLNR